MQNSQSRLDAALLRALDRAAAIDRLMGLVKKQLPPSPQYQDLSKGLHALARYIKTYTSELIEGGHSVLEVGPGVGCFMVLVQELGNTIRGEELSPNAGGDKVAAYAQVTEALGLDVVHGGLGRYLTILPTPLAERVHADGTYDFVHFRGSLDAVLAPYRHNLSQAVDLLYAFMRKILRVEGIMHVSHNADGLRDEIISCLRSQLPRDFTFTVDNVAGITRATRLQ